MTKKYKQDTHPQIEALHEVIGGLLNEIDRLEARNQNAKPVTIEVKTMHLSGGRTDYFVSITCEGREVTPHVFHERFKAEYEVAYYKWVFGQTTEEPDLLAFDENDWPGKVIVS